MRTSIVLLAASLFALGACSSSSAGDTTATACKAPLTDDATFDTPPLAAWCAKGNGHGGRGTKTCDGYEAIIVGEGVDCSTLYLFDPSTKKLVGELHGCNTFIDTCTEGPAGFRMPSAACLTSNGFGMEGGNVCPPVSDGGVDGGDAADATHEG